MRTSIRRSRCTFGVHAIDNDPYPICRGCDGEGGHGALVEYHLARGDELAGLCGACLERFRTEQAWWWVSR